MTRTFGDPFFWDAVKNTIGTAFCAALLGVLMALGFSYFYIFHPGTVMYRIADFMNDLPIALPHTVAGLALLLAFGRNMFGFVGPTGLAFTLVAVILAMFFVSYPLAARTIASSAEEIDRELQRFADQAKKTLEDFKKDMPEGDLGYFKEVATVNKTLKFLKDNASAE